MLRRFLPCLLLVVYNVAAVAQGTHPATGREIAPVMGVGGADWLVRSEREAEEAPGAALDGARAILDVGGASAVLPLHAGLRVERVAGVIMPALVNAHLHLELSALRGKVAGGHVTPPHVVLGPRKNPP